MKTQKQKYLAISVAVGIAIASVPTSAQAYTVTGCKWGNTGLRIDYRDVQGVYRTAFNNARGDYNTKTNMTTAAVDMSGMSFTAYVTNFGNTGYDGISHWSCVLGTTLSADVNLNSYSVPTTANANLIKVLWEHELGHGFGLNHVSSTSHVMFTSARSAFNAGITTLTADEISGINYLY